MLNHIEVMIAIAIISAAFATPLMMQQFLVATGGNGGVTQKVYSAGMSRCGTTTQAFCLWHYLKSLGLRPAMMDKSGTTLSSIQMVFEKEIVIKENALEIRGIPFCETEDADHNAYILDYGRLTPENATHFGKADLSVLVGCTKPWELPAFADALRLVVSHPCRQMVTLASFSTQQDMHTAFGQIALSAAVIVVFATLNRAIALSRPIAYDV